MIAVAFLLCGLSFFPFAAGAAEKNNFQKLLDVIEGKFVDAPTDIEVKEYIARKRGAILLAEKLPAIEKMGRETLDRLTRAAELDGILPAAKNELLIVDSPTAFFHVHALVREGTPAVNTVAEMVEEGRRGNGRKNILVLSTGYIDQLARGKTGRLPSIASEKEAFFHRLAGAMAYEVAFPGDFLDKNGFFTQYDKNIWASGVGKARVLRTDSEAIKLLRTAGFPADSLYQALNFMHELAPKDAENRVAGLLSGTPEHDLRMSSLRQLILAYDFTEGPAAVHQVDPPNLISSALDELEKLTTPAFRKISLDEALLALETYLKGRRGSVPDIQKKMIELTSDLNSALIKAGDHLTQTEKARLVALNAGPMLANHYLPESYFKEVEKVPFYRSDEYQKAWKVRFLGSLSVPVGKKAPVPSPKPAPGFIEELQSKLQEIAGAYLPPAPAPGKENSLLRAIVGRAQPGYADVNLFNDGYLPRLFRTVLPSEAVVPLLHNELEAALARPSQYDSIRASLNAVEPNATDRDLIRLFHEKVLPNLDATALAALNFKSSATEYDPITMRFRANPNIGQYLYFGENSLDDKQVESRLEAARRIFRSDPRLEASAQATARRIWDDRGFFATLDAVGNQSEHYDWPFIFESVGVSAQDGKRALNEAVKAFTSGPRYAELLQEVPKDYQKVRFTLADHPWMDNDLSSYLGGAHLPAGAELSPAVKSMLTTARGNFIAGRAPLFREIYRKEFAKRLEEIPEFEVTAEKLLALNRTLEKELFGAFPEKRALASLPAPVFDLQAKTIADSKLSEEAKRKLLDELYGLKNFNEAAIGGAYRHQYGDTLGGLSEENWLAGGKSQLAEDTYSVLARERMVGTPSELLHSLSAQFNEEWLNEYLRKYSNGASSAHAARQKLLNAREALKNVLRGELAAIQKISDPIARKAALLKFLPVVDPLPGGYQKVSKDTPFATDLKAELSRGLMELSLSETERATAFKHLTSSGATLDTDAFFKKELAPGLMAMEGKVKQILIEDRIANPLLRSDLAVAEIASRLKPWEKTPPTPDAALDALKEVLTILPDPSLARDDLLERIVWKSKLESQELLDFAESKKVANFRNLNPKLADIASFMSEAARDLTVVERLEFIRYLGDPARTGFSTSIESAMVRTIESGLGDGAPSNSGREHAKQTALAKAKDKLERIAFGSSAEEKIPFYEMLLASGQNPVANDGGYPLSIIRGFLGHAPNSNGERFLLAYLNSLPAREKTVTLAYLLSQAGNDGGSQLKVIFEAFGSLGIKTGQIAAIWNSFDDPKITADLETLKDGAKPLSKKEIKTILKRTLSPAEFDRIAALDTVLGSASMKTAVKARLTDGAEVVMLVQRPNAAAQIRGHVNRARAFAQELDKIGLEKEARVAESLIDAADRQIRIELNMSEEAAKIRAAQAFYARMNRKMALSLNGWKFEVPGLVSGFSVRDNLLVIQKVPSTGFGDLPEGVAKHTVGRAIDESFLIGLLREGWVEPDRHRRNTLIDIQRKVIHPIDFGQSEQLKVSASPLVEDDRFRIANFFRAAESGSSEKIVDAGAKFSERALSANQRRELIHQVAVAIKAHPENPALVVNEIAQAFAHAEAPWHARFSIATLKGLLTVSKEAYLPADEFSELLRREVKYALLKKAPLILKESSLAKEGRSCADWFRSLRR